MIPWIADRASANAQHGYLLDGGTGWPHFNLVALLSDILQEGQEKEQLLLLKAPRSVVFHGFGDALYLFWRKSRVPFASLASSGNGISSVGFRYNDPMDQRSGRRKTSRLLTGWQGVAELIDAAVRRSNTWRSLETIEVETRQHYGEERVVYEVWAKPTRTRRVWWSTGRSYNSGAYEFCRNQAEKLARVHVTRQRVNGHLLEEVSVLSPYPELRGEESYSDGSYTNSQWLPYTPSDTAKQPICLPPIYIDLSDHSLMSIRPHDGFELKVNWRDR